MATTDRRAIAASRDGSTDPQTVGIKNGGLEPLSAASAKLSNSNAALSKLARSFYRVPDLVDLQSRQPAVSATARRAIGGGPYVGNGVQKSPCCDAQSTAN